MKMHMTGHSPDLLDRLATGRQRPLRPLAIARATGLLTVQKGRVWVTQVGEFADRVLDAGERLRFDGARSVVIEPWSWADSALLDWAPDPRPQDRLLGALREPLLGAAARALTLLAAWAGGVAAGLRRVEGAFAALARSAASSASRNQGCI